MTFTKGYLPWNKGKSHSINVRMKISESLKGIKRTEKFKENLRKQRTGKKLSLQHRKKLSLAKTKERKFTGFKSTENHRLRNSIEFSNWRTAVFKRDDFTCQNCGIRGSVTLEPHHIKSFADFPKLRFDIDNGITYCKDCHILLDKHRKGDAFMKPNIIHVSVMDGDIETIKRLTNELTKLKEKIPDIEFLITNDKIGLEDIKYLLDELYRLYKNYKTLKESSK
jgi:5-methylcytosine-specific restriction endonuclease McrA